MHLQAISREHVQLRFGVQKSRAFWDLAVWSGNLLLDIVYFIFGKIENWGAIKGGFLFKYAHVLSFINKPEPK